MNDSRPKVNVLAFEKIYQARIELKVLRGNLNVGARLSDRFSIFESFEPGERVDFGAEPARDLEQDSPPHDRLRVPPFAKSDFSGGYCHVHIAGVTTSDLDGLFIACGSI